MSKIRSKITLEGEQVVFRILIGKHFTSPKMKVFSHLQIQKIEKGLKALNLDWEMIPGHKINYLIQGLS